MTPIIDNVLSEDLIAFLLAWQSPHGENIVQVQRQNSFLAIGLMEVLVISVFVTAVMIPIVLIAATRMRAFQSRGLAIAGSVLIMMPVSLIALAGIPVGIWSLMTLMRDDVRHAFAVTTVPAEITRRQLSRAGVWLLVSGILNLLFCICVSITGIIAVTDHPPPSGHYFQTVAPGVTVTTVLFLLTALQIIAARKMMNLTSCRWSHAAAIIGLIPFSPVWLVSLPSSVYAFAVLGQNTDGIKHNRELFAPDGGNQVG